MKENSDASLQFCLIKSLFFSKNYERMNLADALIPQTYAKGDRIIKQGEYEN